MESACTQLLPQIVDKLKSLDPDRVILFGSVAAGTINIDSDIDLIVVLDTQTIPRSYDERLQLKLLVRQALGDISRKVAVDLLVYTKPEYAAFVAQESSFSREICQTGRVLYEKAG